MFYFCNILLLNYNLLISILFIFSEITNLAKALEKDEASFNMLQEIVSMGGAFKSHGNCSQVAEFNYWVDPHSVKNVFDKSKVPFSMVGLDVTREIVLTPNLIELINQFG